MTHPFASRLGFEPDRFQVEAFDAFDDGKHVIVAAPTGAGKTVVASYAVDRCLERGSRVFYTTPIKALSNQKYHDLVDIHGTDNVGLLTGDNVVNGDAPVVVMTTEVLRNMLYAGRELSALAAVVVDEVHYLQDSYRGPVWEEVIIHLPDWVQLVCLSATVSNAEELTDWISLVRGETSLVVETTRPVELENWYLVGERKTPKLHALRTLVGGKANHRGFRFDPDLRRKNKGRGDRRKRRPPATYRTPDRVSVVNHLRQHELLPAIYFIFSRQACNEAARDVASRGIVLTTEQERDEIRRIVSPAASALSEEDRRVLDYDSFVVGLEAGVAPHHAGMVPLMKELVEACFVEGLIKVVFATETLALGINMPARTVVIDKLTKWTGEQHQFLTPAQYTQLTGRAGRRGIDVKGDAVVLWSPWVRFEQVAGLAGSREFVLTSAFRPTYNMSANLVRRYEPEEARHLLNLSFAQYRQNAKVIHAERALDRLTERRNQVASRLEKEFGPVDELRAAARVVEAPTAHADDLAFALSRVDRGEILALDGPDLPERGLVITVAYRRGGRVKVHVVEEDLTTTEVTAGDLDSEPIVIGRIELPEPYLPHSMSFLHEAVERMKRAQLLGPKRRESLAPQSDYRRAADLPAGARRGLKRLDKIDLELAEATLRLHEDADSLSRQFDAVIDLLTERGHIVDWSLTTSGQRLARLYHECDLLIVECLESGVFDGLNPAELAGVVSCLIYEDRSPDQSRAAWYPSPVMREAFAAMVASHEDLLIDEGMRDLNRTRAPDAGFMGIAHAWAAGGDLGEILLDEELSAGDFVRTAKLLIDLLKQLSVLAPVPETQKVAARAADGVHRGLVASSGTVDG